MSLSYADLENLEMQICFIEYKTIMPEIVSRAYSDADINALADFIIYAGSSYALSALIALGKEFIKCKMFNQAILVFEKITKWKESSYVYYQLAQSYYKTYQYEKCQNCLNHCQVDLSSPATLILQLNLWRKIKQYDKVITKTNELLADNNIQEAVKNDILNNLFYTYMEIYRQSPENQDLFYQAESYFKQLADTHADSCYGLIFLYEIAYKNKQISYSNALEWIQFYLLQGSKLDSKSHSKHFDSAQDVLLKLKTQPLRGVL